MKLLDEVFGDQNIRPTPKDGLHHIGVAGDFLLVACAEPLDFQITEQAEYYRITPD